MNQDSFAVQMYEYFKQNRAKLPDNIVCQREYILNALSKGEEIAEVFAQAAKNADSVLVPKAKIIKMTKILILRKTT
jgi:hypothetical protein